MEYADFQKSTKDGTPPGKASWWVMNTDDHWLACGIEDSITIAVGKCIEYLLAQDKAKKWAVNYKTPDQNELIVFHGKKEIHLRRKPSKPSRLWSDLKKWMGF